MKETVTKSGRKTGAAAVVGAPRKSGAALKTAASALAKKIAGAVAPAAKAKPARAQVAPVSKPAARPASKAAAKPAPAAKAKAAPKVAATAAVKPAARTRTATGPAKAAPVKAPARATPKTAARAGAKAVSASKIAAAAKAGPAPKVPARPRPQAAEEGSKKTAAQPAVKVVDPRANTAAAAGAVAGSADKMETSVVSKVSEVMTKTTKSSPAANPEGRLLSEEEIRAMSEKDYMNAAQLAFFKARLQQLEKDLLKNAGETTEHLRETVLVPDPADRATIEEEHALELRTRDRERKLLKKVQQSIAAIDSGDYGWCEETGEPIGIPRLIARPTATLSLEAQQRRELKQKLYGD
jgi:DnaK suppressor protein